MQPKKHKKNSSLIKLGAFMTAVTASALQSNDVAAIGADSDGWITPQLGHPMFITYLSRSSSTNLYHDDKKTSDNARLSSNVALFRYLYPIDVGRDVIMTPNVVLPVVDIKTSGDLSSVGDTKGFGDLMLVNGLWLIHDWKERKHLAIIPFIWLPTGKYSHGSSINVGENRYKYALQVGGQYPLSDSWDFAGSIDTTWYGENKDNNLTQKPLTEINSWFKYNFDSPNFSHAAIGLAHISGGQSQLGSEYQDDEQKTTAVKLQYGTLIDDSKTRHVLFTIAKDIVVQNGLQTDYHLEVRFSQIF